MSLYYLKCYLFIYLKLFLELKHHIVTISNVIEILVGIIDMQYTLIGICVAYRFLYF